MNRILIRVDATPEIGMGHLMRMVALGQLLQDHGYDVHFATVAPADEASGPIAANNFALHRLPGQPVIGSAEDARALRTLVGSLRPSWVVLDGYAFGTEYQRLAKAGEAKVMSVDDLARDHFVSDVVLNQNYGAERLMYSVEPHTRLLLGPAHVMLRREFRSATRRERPADERPTRVLVTLGGGSVAGSAALDSVVRGLELLTLPGLRFRIVVGMLGEPSGYLRGLSAADPERFHLIRATGDMAREMSESDIAITSGGSTVWELIHMRVPFIALALNEPQLGFLAMLQADGVCISLGSHLALDPQRVSREVEALLAGEDLRQRMLATSTGIIDSRQSQRELLEALASR